MFGIRLHFDVVLVGIGRSVELFYIPAALFVWTFIALTKNISVPFLRSARCVFFNAKRVT
jgi:hypothetical protein